LNAPWTHYAVAVVVVVFVVVANLLHDQTVLIKRFVQELLLSGRVVVGYFLSSRFDNEPSFSALVAKISRYSDSNDLNNIYFSNWHLIFELLN
jgi:hypothetical protein